MKVLAMPPPHDQLIDLVDQIRQQFKLGRDLGARDDREQRPRRFFQGFRQRIEFGHQQRPTASNLSKANRAMRGRLGPVRGAERIHNVHIAKCCVFLRQRFVVLALADIHPAVLQQDQLPGLHRDTIDPVADQRDLTPQMFRQPLRDRCERLLRTPHAFLWPPQMRSHHHGRAFLQRQTQRRQRRKNALLGRDPTVLHRHVEVFADQHALAGEVEVGHAEDGHACCSGAAAGGGSGERGVLSAATTVRSNPRAARAPHDRHVTRP